MPVPRIGLTTEQVEAFRERAVAVATELFGERGYQGVTLRSLAAELGVSPMTPYRYFENKEELFAMVRADAFRRFADAQRDASALPADPAESLQALGMAYVRFALAQPSAYRIMFELQQAPAGTYEALEREQARAFSFLHAAVQGAIDAGLMDGDPLHQAHMMWAKVHGLVSLHLAGKLGMGCTLEDLLPEVFDQRRAAE
ncbi:MAG: TetR/AcrR family transcriptional regulator [Polyangiales bacterium]